MGGGSETKASDMLTGRQPDHLTPALMAEAEQLINGALSNLQKLSAVDAYCSIQEYLHQCDVGTDLQFQTRFNHYYRVRRDSVWREAFFTLMEKSKRDGISFDRALADLFNRTGRLEASFASKLVATIDPNQPVIDSVVLRRFGLRLPYHSAPDRLQRVIRVYEQLSDGYARLMGLPIGVMMRERFASAFPGKEITELKKIDLILWQVRDAA